MSMRNDMPNDESAVLSERCLTSLSDSDKVISDAAGVSIYGFQAISDKGICDIVRSNRGPQCPSRSPSLRLSFSGRWPSYWHKPSQAQCSAPSLTLAARVWL